MPRSDSIEPEFVSIQASARLLDVGPHVIRALIAAGELQAYRIGPRVVRIRRADLDALLRPLHPEAAANG